MTEKERKKYDSLKSEFLNIGITNDGKSIDVIGIPWKKTSNAFKMHTPDIYFEYDDICRELDRLRTLEVWGCYVFDKVGDLDFIRSLKELRDIYISDASDLTDLDFLRDNDNWHMLYLKNANLKNLDFLRNLKSRLQALCLCFEECSVEDLSALDGLNLRVSEFIVVGDGADRDKWEKYKFVNYYVRKK